MKPGGNTTDKQQIIDWLLEGDVSIQYQVHRDLLSIERLDLRNRIALEGWGALFLSKRRPDGHWGIKFYRPKWTSSHYTLLDLRNLSIAPDHPEIRESLEMIVTTEKGKDGGISPASTVHSSLHTTLSVLEGITIYERNGYKYRLDELREACQSSLEFKLLHRLFLSDRTGEIINHDFLRFSFPCRWRYDILRGLDYMQYAGRDWDDRMNPAIQVLLKKKSKDLTWNMPARHPGQVHFDMETAGKPSRWNTLRALRVLKNFKIE